MTSRDEHFGEDIPVITIIRVIPNEDRATDVIEWFKKISITASQFEGFVKSEMFESSNEINAQELLNIFVFDSYRHLTLWEKSRSRADALFSGRLLFKESEEKQRLAGMEFLFHQKRSEAVVAPSRWKMVAVTSIIIFTLLHTIMAWMNVAFILFALPNWIWNIFSVIFMVWFMTYILMPVMTKLLSRWLYTS